tara:strand:+ start:205 stop:429 length:225 start_codon:yes stop_codon:yes gene_type:complete
MEPKGSQANSSWKSLLEYILIVSIILFFLGLLFFSMSENWLNEMRGVLMMLIGGIIFLLAVLINWIENKLNQRK